MRARALGCLAQFFTPGHFLSLVFLAVFAGAVEVLVDLKVIGAPNVAFSFFYFMGWGWLLAEWMYRDCKRHHILTRPSCGMFYFCYAILFLPAHLFRTRGWFGFLSFAGIWSLYFVPHCIAYAVK